MYEDRKWILERIGEVYSLISDFKNTWLEDNTHGRPRPCVCWEDGSTLGYGLASHMTGNPGGFKFLGFSGYHEFYSLPKEKRNRFLDEGLKIFKEVFKRGRKGVKTEDLEKNFEKVVEKLKKLAKKYKKYKRDISYDT